MDKDIEMLTLLNRHGFGTADIFQELGFWSHIKSVQRRLNKLAGKDLIEKKRLFYRQPLIYWPTWKGAKMSHSSLESPDGPPRLDMYQHDLTVLHIYLDLIKRTGGSWITERELWSRGEFNARYPDGVLVQDDSDEEYVAIEFENSPKQRSRMRDIIDNYRSKHRDQYDRVIFFCSKEHLMDRVNEAGADDYQSIDVLQYSPVVEL